MTPMTLHLLHLPVGKDDSVILVQVMERRGTSMRIKGVWSESAHEWVEEDWAIENNRTLNRNIAQS